MEDPFGNLCAVVRLDERQSENRGESLVYADVWLSAPDPGPDRCLWLPESLLSEWALPLGTTVELSYGLRSTQASVGVVGTSGKGGRRRFIVPSENLAHELSLVADLEYRIARTGPASLTLGPVIGLLAELEQKNGGPWSDQERWTGLLQAYGEVKGLTVLLGPGDVDWASGVVDGRYYNPSHEAGPWILGRFPVPAAVHRRAPLSQSAETDWLQGTAERIFNARWQEDKWELYQAIVGNSELASHVTPARLASSHQVVREMLENAGSVYLKPRVGTRGQGVMRLDRAGDGVTLLYRSQDRSVRRHFRSRKELRLFLVRQKVISGRYIVQESVPCATIGGHRFDLRLHIQRSGSGEFCCPGKLARLAPPDSAVTHLAHGGIALPVDLALTVGLRISLDEAREVERRVVEWSCDFVRKLEAEFHTLGDVGVDVTVDSKGEIWLVECDMRPDHTQFEGFDADMHRTAATMWHRFASYLAGFPVS